ncbi:MAG TPA: response regulator [Flavobacteriales bacterium]
MATKVDVLCVEDNEDFLRFLSHSFNKLEQPVRYDLKRSGQEALQALNGGQGSAGIPRMILLDLNLPGLSGFDVLKEIRANSRWRHIPVVVLTSSSDPRDIELAHMMGANAYLSKPSTLAELRSLLESTCRFWLEHHVDRDKWN